jgi:hypothetical protein
MSRMMLRGVTVRSYVIVVSKPQEELASKRGILWKLTNEYGQTKKLSFQYVGIKVPTDYYHIPRSAVLVQSGHPDARIVQIENFEMTIL